MVIVLSRKSGEALVIGEVVVTCLLIAERQVRLVFDLPGGVDVYRREDLEEGHTLHRRIGRRRQERTQTVDVQCGQHLVLCDHFRSDVHVRSIGEQVVRIEVEAPSHLSVHRKEIYDAIQRAQDEENGRDQRPW
jgi:carbon storage regulator CsrA